MIRHTIFAVFKDVKDIKSRSFMTGVYFEKEGDTLTMVATNGNRLSC
ncbi:MAG: DNA polymerase III subunit beta, partial [Treponema sp.]|nr:DNA polymerase III subunit beta [Treponema sp.]